MFVDEVKLKIIAGRGGNGRASFSPVKVARVVVMVEMAVVSSLA